MLGIPDATRVYGPTLTLRLCQAAAAEGISIGLYGGTPDSLQEFSGFLHRRFPGIQISCSIAPPFRPLTQDEDERYTREIEESGTQILLVGIGCPKQEKWMYAHRDKLQAVMVGVGAAFDFHAGRVKQAPSWIRKSGLEWLFRLSMEPSRLWRRYARIVPRFIGAFGWQLIQHLVTQRVTSSHHSEADAPLSK
jgi:N-acetylglucosaminyldiphosphoundecaprenol N-acetyl-beta-D-mannosaminyltransferase